MKTINKISKETEEKELTDEEKETLKPIFESVVDKKFTIQMESMSETDAPVVITQPEFMRRMQEQQRMGGGGMMGAFPEMFNFIVNVNHPVVGAVLTKEGDAKKNSAKQLADLAMLSQGMLRGEELTNFISRSVELMK